MKIAMEKVHWSYFCKWNRICKFSVKSANESQSVMEAYYEIKSVKYFPQWSPMEVSIFIKFEMEWNQQICNGRNEICDRSSK